MSSLYFLIKFSTSITKFLDFNIRLEIKKIYVKIYIHWCKFKYKKAVFQMDLKLVEENKIFCDGKDKSDGHPRIYLEVSDMKVTTCPYCSMKFKRK